MSPAAADLMTAAALFAPRLAASVMVLAGCWLGGRALQAVVARAASGRLDRSVVTLIRKALQTTALVFGTITALGTVRINVSALIAGLGLTGFALGFALKDLVANVVAGVLILVYRPFRRNDWVAVAGFEGVAPGRSRRGCAPARRGVVWRHPVGVGALAELSSREVPP